MLSFAIAGCCGPSLPGELMLIQFYEPFYKHMVWAPWKYDDTGLAINADMATAHSTWMSYFPSSSHASPGSVVMPDAPMASLQTMQPDVLPPNTPIQPPPWAPPPPPTPPSPPPWATDQLFSSWSMPMATSTTGHVTDYYNPLSSDANGGSSASNNGFSAPNAASSSSRTSNGLELLQEGLGSGLHRLSGSGTGHSRYSMAGLGFGLPLSRLYARYFGGDIKLQVRLPSWWDEWGTLQSNYTCFSVNSLTHAQMLVMHPWSWP